MDFLNGSFRIGRLLGINVRVHMLFILWVAFRLSSSHGDVKFALAFLALLFGIVLIHEFGHCLGARSVGGDAEEILLWPLGGLAFAHAPMRPWPQFVTVACGPLVNVVFCIISGAAIAIIFGGVEYVPIGIRSLSYPPITEEWHRWLVLFYVINYYLLLFNMLPIYPMDGGQLLWTILWPFLGLRRATLVATQIGLGGAVLLGGWGMMMSNYMLVAIAVMGGLTCYQRMMAARSGFIAEEFLSVDPMLSDKRRTGFWSRLFRRRPKMSAPLAENPNPGGWESKVTAEDALSAQVDEILEKVHRHGIQSLSYVERQTLERVTRLRRERDAGFPGSLNP
ncbi:Peptidase family M50 [Phycisphaerae bacterium RAS1]|nr:Peptidase family M50 [Phycisphaerae bacterium RAS1]